MSKTRMTKRRPKKEMTVEELKKELRGVFRKLDKLEGPEKDVELGSLFLNLPGQTGFNDLIALIALAEILRVFSKYLGVPLEVVSLPKKDVPLSGKPAEVIGWRKESTSS